MTDLPQLYRPFLTDGGLETDLLFNHGINLPYFSSTTLLDSEEKRAALADYYRPYVATAREHGLGFIFESPTWRASPDWAAPLGLTEDQLADRNREAIGLMKQLQREQTGVDTVISGCIGPRGDGYDPGSLMTAEEARAYHGWQARLFAEEGADLVTAITMNNVPEAIGVAKAAADAGLPSAISFTVETDGKLPTGDTLGEAIAAVDAATDNGPAYYMVNCAHPDHFNSVLDPDAEWAPRLKGVRANASRMSHAELDEMEELDDGDPAELGAQHRELCERFGNLTVMGGCCGTDHRHVAEIAKACFARV